MEKTRVLRVGTGKRILATAWAMRIAICTRTRTVVTDTSEIAWVEHPFDEIEPVTVGLTLAEVRQQGQRGHCKVGPGCQFCGSE
jgi:hypothetical protein